VLDRFNGSTFTVAVGRFCVAEAVEVLVEGAVCRPQLGELSGLASCYRVDRIVECLAS